MVEQEVQHDCTSTNRSQQTTRRYVMASTNGQTTFNCGLVVPADKVEEVEEVLAIHADWMRETHSLESIIM